MNPYENCPNYATERFLLRPVRMEDARALLACYSDPQAVANMNADNCANDFYCATLAQMQAQIRFWMDERAAGRYVRYAVADRALGDAVGTMEIFGGETGVLRIDLPVRYENESVMRELIGLVAEKMTADFPMGRLCIMAEKLPARRNAAVALGFVPSGFHGGKGYYEYDTKEVFA